MNNEEIETFTTVVIALHRQKDASYGNSWKKRGELISIMANIARKVDRLEVIAAGGVASIDESTLDTAVDLYVYTLKYLTYLADTHPETAREYFGSPRPDPLSDGPEGFEHLITRIDRSGLFATGTAADAVADTLSTFSNVEQRVTAQPPAPASARAAAARCLADQALRLIGTIRAQDVQSYETFLSTWDRP